MKDLSAPKFNKFTSVAQKAARAGAKVLKKYFHGALNVEFKGAIDPVTQADKLSQAAVIAVIKKAFPTHSIIAEEGSLKDVNNKNYCWIIDPLDGTVNFIHRLPLFCVSVALKYKNEIIAGVVYAPVLNEMFVAQAGKGAYLNGKKIKVSKTKDIIKSLAVTGFPYYVRERKSKNIINSFKNIVLEAQGVRRLGSAALDLAWVGAGRFEFFWEEGLKPWDVAAGALIVKEAGGKVTDYKGKNNYLFGAEIAASNNKMHNEVIKLLNAK